MVERIVCDRRGDEAKRGDVGFGEMICTAFHAGVGLSFADGSRVMVDLCQPCFCAALGPWLRRLASPKTLQEEMLSKFRPEVHGGEFPPPPNT